MKINKKAVITAAVIFSAAMNLTACAYGPPEDEEYYDPDYNMNVNVYGPPPEYYESEDNAVTEIGNDDEALQDKTESSSAD